MSLMVRFQKLILPEGIPYDRKTGFETAKLGITYEQNRRSAGQSSLIGGPTGNRTRPSSMPWTRNADLLWAPHVENYFRLFYTIIFSSIYQFPSFFLFYLKKLSEFPAYAYREI